jgi:hypothetical protein
MPDNAPAPRLGATPNFGAAWARVAPSVSRGRPRSGVSLPAMRPPHASDRGGFSPLSISHLSARPAQLTSSQGRRGPWSSHTTKRRPMFPLRRPSYRRSSERQSSKPLAGDPSSSVVRPSGSLGEKRVQAGVRRVRGFLREVMAAGQRLPGHGHRPLPPSVEHVEALPDRVLRAPEDEQGQVTFRSRSLRSCSRSIDAPAR